ncbi:FG-GAP repeat-containing protein [Toxoplasma gondii TgCatPRC2]|uniref:FG-GAP repeat-containing protein n=1 Tax=Toxoplasma gondii TgCatPRC2 TaxID=1130821 RepID=A0A151H1E8_TOXGO|nr:FG-GAP repeat-containing protein [Toxoplasma gondii TgCatPRC2]
MRSRRRVGGGEEAEGRGPQPARQSCCSGSHPSPLSASAFDLLGKKDTFFSPNSLLGAAAMTAGSPPPTPSVQSSSGSSRSSSAASPARLPASASASPSLPFPSLSSSFSFVAPSSSAATAPPLVTLPTAETAVSAPAAGPAEGGGAALGFDGAPANMDRGMSCGALEVGGAPDLPSLHLGTPTDFAAEQAPPPGDRGLDTQSALPGGRLRANRSFALFLIVLLSIVLFISFVITPFSSFLIDLSLQSQTSVPSLSPPFPSSQDPSTGSPTSSAASDEATEPHSPGSSASKPRSDADNRDSAPRVPHRQPKPLPQIRLEQARARGHSAAAAFPDEVVSGDSSKAFSPGNASLSSTLFSRFGSLSIFPSLSLPRDSAENASAIKKKPSQDPNDRAGTRSGGNGAAVPPSPPTAVGGGGAGAGAPNRDATSRPTFTPYRPVDWGVERVGDSGADISSSSEANDPNGGTSSVRGPSPSGLYPSASGLPLKRPAGEQDGWRGELAEFADYNGDSHADMIFISRSTPDEKQSVSSPAVASTSPFLLSAFSASRSTPRSTAFAAVYTWDAAAGVFAFFTKAEVPESTESLISFDWNGDGRADLLAVCVAEPNAVAEARREAMRLFQRLQEEGQGRDAAREGQVRPAEHKKEEKELHQAAVKSGEEGKGDAGAASSSFFRFWFGSPSNERGEEGGDRNEVGKNYYLVAYVQRSDGKLEEAWDSITGVDRLLERLEQQRVARRRRMARARESRDRDRQHSAASNERSKQAATHLLAVSEAPTPPQTPSEIPSRGEEARAEEPSPAMPRRRLAENEGESGVKVVESNGNQTDAPKQSLSFPLSGDPSSPPPPRRPSGRDSALGFAPVSPVLDSARNAVVARRGGIAEEGQQEEKGVEKEKKGENEEGDGQQGRGKSDAQAIERGGREEENFAHETVNAAREEEDETGFDSPSSLEDGIEIQGVRVWGGFGETPETLSNSLSDKRRVHLENLALLPLLRFSSIHPLVADVTMDGRPDLIAQAPLFRSPSPLASSAPPFPSPRPRRFAWIAASRAEAAVAKASSGNRSDATHSAKRGSEETAPEGRRHAAAAGEFATGAKTRREREGEEGEEGEGMEEKSETEEKSESERRRGAQEEAPFQPVLWQNLDKWIANAGEAEEKQLLGKIVSPHSSAFLDLDGDCRPDLVFQVELPSPPSASSLSPPTSSSGVSSSPAPSPSASPSASSQYLEIWVSRFDAQEAQARYTIAHDAAFIALPPNVRQLSFADFNADGTLDLVMPTCVPSPECNGCCVEADRILFAPNKQPGLCPSLWSFSSPSRAPCRAANALCSLPDYFSIPSMNEAPGEFTVTNIDSDPRVHFYGDQDHPPTLRVGDWNGDGYPDLAFIAVRNGGYRTARLYHNVPAEGKGDASLRTFELAHDITPEEGGDGVSLLFDQVAFFDLFEDGSLDVFCMGQPEPPSTSSSPFTSSRAFLRTLDSDSRFLKVTALSADSGRSGCSGRSGGRSSEALWRSVFAFPESKAEAGGEGRGDERTSASVLQMAVQHSLPPSGVASHGPAFKLTVTDLNGVKTPRTATQLSQSAHSPLQLPYALFGLGRTNNYIEEFYLGMPISAQVCHNMWISLIPNSQVLVAPSPLYCPKAWQLDLSVNPSKHVFYILITTLICLIVVAIIIFILDRREKAEDSELQRGFRSHFIIN